MRNFKEGLENVPEVKDMEGTVPGVMADAKKVSEERQKKINAILAKHRKETGAKEDKPFTGTKGDIMKGTPNPELKKLDLNESLFESAGLREYTNKILEMVEEGIVDKYGLINDLLQYMSEDDVKDFYNTYFDADEGLLNGNTINLNVDASGQSAAFLSGKSGDVVNEVLNDNTINLNVDASGSSVGFLGGTAGQVTNEAILNDDGDVYDMYYFLYGLFTDSGDDNRKPINPFGGRGKRKFDYNSKTIGHEIDLEMNTPVHTNRDGDIVLEAETPEAFDWAKKTCDFFQVDYEVKESNRAASKNRFKYEMVVFVPFDYEGNPATVEDYFAEIGLDPKDYIAKLDTGRNKVSGKFNNLSKTKEEKPA